MSKEKYAEAEIKIVTLDVVDVITTSDNVTYPTTGDNDIIMPSTGPNDTEIL